MKEFAQALLILGGGLGLLGAVPAAIYGWKMHRGFGGDLTGRDYLLLYSPLLCLAALAAGLVWRRVQTRKTRRPRFRLTEDGGAGGE